MEYHRRKTHEVKVGEIGIGGNNPIRLQSMANTSTMDTDASAEQALRIYNAGGELVRFTAQGVREAENLERISTVLRDNGCDVPLVADIHFNPKAAEAAASRVEKVRINPGNFVDKIKTFDILEYSEQEYQMELDKIRERFVPFLTLCRTHDTAIRIGVNHGSLSDRIMSRFGDTPQGMVESAMEFLRICVEEDFTNVVVSMKASNTVVMVQSVRLLVERMEGEYMMFPLHLGVTEAGEGEDGRIKSAVGMGALLMDGIGDTVRVSLSENPECEIPVARKMVDFVMESIDGSSSEEYDLPHGYDWAMPARRAVNQSNPFAAHYPKVLGRVDDETHTMPDFTVENGMVADNTTGVIYPLFRYEDINIAYETDSRLAFVRLDCSEIDEEWIELMKERSHQFVLILTSSKHNRVADLKRVIHQLISLGCDVPVVLRLSYSEEELESLQLKASIEGGALFLSGMGDGLYLLNDGEARFDVADLSLGILQASRLRFSKTEYISCPGCGRTLYDLQSTVAKVKQATKHLTGLKIAVMGCIVNGPGEMADADYGYVGSGRGEVDLYKGKQCIEKRIPEDQALAKLLNLIESES